jgi:DNA helicase-2/ATP-dependent DNA helicase PcrA
MAITFTNKAAEEMKKRVSDYTGYIPDWTRTFHSACVKSLRLYGEAIGLNPRFEIAMESDRKTLVTEALKNVNADSKEYLKRAMHLITLAKNSGDNPIWWMNTVYQERLKYKNARVGYVPKAVEVYRVYQELLKNYNRLDFDDLLLEAVRLLKTCPDVRDSCKAYFEYILVDEYQDTNPVQEQLLENLVRDGNVTVVGDDYQAIYGFRGAVVEHFLNFKKKYNAEIVHLNRNFRSTDTIVQASAALIKKNSMQIHKGLFSKDKRLIPITLIEEFTPEAEVIRLVEIISGLLKSGRHNYCDLSVLYRASYLSHALQRELLKKGIPFVILGDTLFFMRKEINILILYLNAIFRKDELALLQAISRFPRGLGSVNLTRLKNMAQSGQKNLFEVLQDVANTCPKGLGRKQYEAIKIVVNLTKAVQGCQNPGDAVNALLKALNHIGFTEHLQKESKNKEQFQDRLDNIQEFIDYCKSKSDIDTLLEEVALLSDQSVSLRDKNAINLATVHKAKGLEWSVVFIIGAEEGTFPTHHVLATLQPRRLSDDSNSVSGIRQMEEERRLFYVAMTRAKERLFISRAIYRKGERVPLSRFVREIPKKHLFKV